MPFLQERIKTLVGGKDAADIDAENYEMKKDINILEEELQVLLSFSHLNGVISYNLNLETKKRKP